MKNAIAANPGAVWKIAVFHHAPYSEAFHYDESIEAGEKEKRFNLTLVFDELGIDVALSGHDHSYTRTYHMRDNEPIKNQSGLTPEAISSLTKPACFTTRFLTRTAFYT